VAVAGEAERGAARFLDDARRSTSSGASSTTRVGPRAALPRRASRDAVRYRAELFVPLDELDEEPSLTIFRRTDQAHFV